MAPASLSAAYRRFWHEVGEQFPDLGGAASTAYYLENEKRLLSEHVPDLGRCAVLKTDLWDEVKNTRILQWVHGAGGGRLRGRHLRADRPAGPGRILGRGPARGGGRRAEPPLPRPQLRRDLLDGHHRALPRPRDGAARDAPRAAAGRPRRGGRAEPVGSLPAAAPGAPRSRRCGSTATATSGRFRAGRSGGCCEAAGFEVVAETAILFVPGWLRMADLALHSYVPPLARADRRRPQALRMARRARAGRAPARLPARLGGRAPRVGAPLQRRLRT